MFLNHKLPKLDVTCINLYLRQDRRCQMRLQCKNKNIPVRFYTKRLQKDQKRGCLESHLNVIAESIKRGKNKHLL